MAGADLAEAHDLLASFVGDEQRVREVTERALLLFERADPAVWGAGELRRLAARAIGVSLEQLGAVAQGSLALEDLTLAPASAELVIAQVRRGVTIDQALHLADLVRETAWESWLNTVEPSGSSPEVQARAIALVATETLRVSSALSREISRLHAVERERWLRGRATRVARAVSALLESHAPVGDPELEALLSYRLRGPHRAVIVWRADAADGRAEALEDAARAAVGQHGLVVQVDVHAVWGWGSGDIAPGDDGAPLGVRVAYGGAHAGVTGFRRSHREARLARQVAEVAADVGDPVVYDDVALLALALQDEAVARAFVDGVVAPLREAGERGAGLAQTVRVYLEHQASPRRTAHAVGLHENTVINRVRAAEELLGRSVEARHPELLVALTLAEALGGFGEGDASP